MRIHEYHLKTGITRTPEFEKKKLASFAVNSGTKCGHGCTYCSTGSLLRMHPCFKALGVSPFENGYAIVDPTMPERVARDAQRIEKRGMIQLSTTVDAWAPEAQKHDLGRRCLEAILAEPDWTVRILTKNAAVTRDFDLIEKHRDRVLFGLSITAPPDKEDVISIIEPNASAISERMAVMREAHRRGLRTYAMLCPLLPRIADAPEQIGEMVRFAVQCGCEEIFTEPVNARGNSLRLTQEALAGHGQDREAAAIANIRSQVQWSAYVVRTIQNIQRAVCQYCDISKLRILLYPSRLLPSDVEAIRSNDASVIWLGKTSPRHHEAR